MKFKIYYPHGGGMAPLTQEKGRWRGRPVLFDSREQADQYAKGQGWRKYVVVTA